MASTTLDGRPEKLEQYAGKWIMLKVGGGECLEACQKQLFAMRQLRTMQGKNMDRMERVWLITDNEPLDTVLMREYDGMELLRARVFPSGDRPAPCRGALPRLHRHSAQQGRLSQCALLCRA